MAAYHLAICEDDPDERAHLEALCSSLLSARQIDHTLSPFASAEALAEALEGDTGRFDLLFLDIQMAGMSGMELARTLYAQHVPVRFLFITGCADYALEGHSVHPVHYLLKPVELEALDQALYRDWQAHHQARAMIFRMGGKTVSLPAGDISYMESLNRMVIVHLPGEEHAFPITLADAERMALPALFARCHNSFLVNLDQVKSVGRTEVLLRDGSKLPVGRRFYRSFQSALVRRINRY